MRGVAVADLMAPLRESLAAAKERRSVGPPLTLAELITVECVRCGAFASVLPEAGPVLCKEHGGRRF